MYFRLRAFYAPSKTVEPNVRRPCSPVQQLGFARARTPTQLLSHDPLLPLAGESPSLSDFESVVASARCSFASSPRSTRANPRSPASAAQQRPDGAPAAPEPALGHSVASLHDTPVSHASSRRNSRNRVCASSTRGCASTSLKLPTYACPSTDGNALRLGLWVKGQGFTRGSG